MRLYVESMAVFDISDRPVEVRLVTAEWTEDAVSWLSRTSEDGWNSAGGDMAATALSSVSHSALAPGTWTEFALPAHVVQGWIDDPASNRGVILRLNPDDAQAPGLWGSMIATFASSEHPDASRRPALEITVGTPEPEESGGRSSGCSGAPSMNASPLAALMAALAAVFCLRRRTLALAFAAAVAFGGCLPAEPVDRTLLDSPLMRSAIPEPDRDLAETGAPTDSHIGGSAGGSPGGGGGGCPT